MKPLPEQKDYIEMALKDGLYFALAAFELDLYEHPSLQGIPKAEIARKLKLSRATLGERMKKFAKIIQVNND
jgi:hypothetical protein